MANDEQDTIAHLLQIEEEAAELISQAQIQSEKEISAARAQADSEYNQKYETMASQMEGDYNSKIAGMDQAHKNQLDEYKSQIEQTPKDLDAFNNLLEKIL